MLNGLQVELQAIRILETDRGKAMLRFICSCGDHFPTADITLKYTTRVANGTCAVASVGRNGGKGFSIAANNAASLAYIQKTLDSQATWTMGMAFETTGTPPGSYTMFGLQDGGATQVDVRLNNDMTMSVTRNGTVLGTTSFSLTANTYFYIELKATINNSTGTFDLHVNGVSRVSASSQNTRNTSNNSANGFFLGHFAGSGSSPPTFNYDDFYCADAQAGQVTTFLGDQRVECLFPTSNGSVNNFAKTGGATNAACVNEVNQDGDTSYVSDGTAGDEDNYNFGSLATAAGAVNGVQSVLCAKNDSAGSKSIAAMYKSGATDTAGATVVLASTSYAYYTEAKELNPTTGVPWTIADVNAGNFGVKIIA